MAPKRDTTSKKMTMWLLIALPVAFGMGTLDERYAMNVTVYHLNSASQGAVPKGMDVSDLAGDIFFSLSGVILPLECAHPELDFQGECLNDELVADDLVVSKLVLEVDSRFGEYGRCNVCGENGIDPFSGLSCEPSTYFCSCGDYLGAKECDGSAVGMENVGDVLQPEWCDWDLYVKAPWSCWALNVLKATNGGRWYSMTEAGYCDDRPDGMPCSWRVVNVEKVVSKECSDAALINAVQSNDSDGCFDLCPRTPEGSFNTSSNCYIGCFYKTVLGPRGMLPIQSHRENLITDGMSFADLADAWSRPFESDDPLLDGCPPYDISRHSPSQKDPLAAATAIAHLRSEMLREYCPKCPKYLFNTK